MDHTFNVGFMYKLLM